jgi:hypothetical protein
MDELPDGYDDLDRLCGRCLQIACPRCGSAAPCPGGWAAYRRACRDEDGAAGQAGVIVDPDLDWPEEMPPALLRKLADPGRPAH